MRNGRILLFNGIKSSNNFAVRNDDNRRSDDREVRQQFGQEDILSECRIVRGDNLSGGVNAMEKSTWHYFKLGLKIGVAFFATIIFILFLSHNATNNQKNGRAVNDEPPPAPKVEEKVTVNYDALQQIFLALNGGVMMQQFEEFIVQNQLPHTRNVYADYNVTYRVAYRQSDALQRYGTEGDYLDVTFDERSQKIISWHYYNLKHFADAYYFVTPFRENNVQYIGYVYHDYEKKDDGRSYSYSNYYQCSGGEETLQRVLNNKR